MRGWRRLAAAGVAGGVEPPEELRPAGVASSHGVQRAAQRARELLDVLPACSRTPPRPPWWPRTRQRARRAVKRRVPSGLAGEWWPCSKAECVEWWLKNWKFSSESFIERLELWFGPTTQEVLDSSKKNHDHDFLLQKLKYVFNKLYEAVELIIIVKFGAVNLTDHDTLPTALEDLFISSEECRVLYYLRSLVCQSFWSVIDKKNN